MMMYDFYQPFSKEVKLTAVVLKENLPNIPTGIEKGYYNLL